LSNNPNKQANKLTSKTINNRGSFLGVACGTFDWTTLMLLLVCTYNVTITNISKTFKKLN